MGKRISFFSEIMQNTLGKNIATVFNEVALGDHELIPRYRSRPLPNEAHYGMVDLFLFPLIADLFLKYGWPQRSEKTFLAGYGPREKWIIEEEKASLFRTVIAYLGLALQVPRVSLALALTLLLLPLIIFFHVLKMPFVPDKLEGIEFRYSS